MKLKIDVETTALELILKMYKGISKQKAKNIIKSSSFICNGEEVKTIPSTLFSPSQEVEILKNTASPKQPLHPSKKNGIVIKFEDKYLIVAIKPVGVLSCKGPTQRGNSFDKMLREYVSDRDRKKTPLWIVHRLDREVEGLIIFAKSEGVQGRFKGNWDELTKKYLALTEARPSPPSGFIESWLKDGFKHKMNVFENEVEGAKLAKTEYKFLEQKGKYSLLEIILHTGRKNQIRAHLSSINCPIVGDFTYNADSSVVRQIRLVAYYLEFKHPMLDKTIELKYLPRDTFYKPSQSKDENYK